MWYVIQTFSGEEDRTADIIRRMVPLDCFEECFVLKRERLKKFHGSWNKVEEVLFNGYTFIASDKPGKLYEELKKIPRLTKVLGREEDYFVPLNKEEEKLVQKIGNDEHKAVISKVVIEEGKRVGIIKGQLKVYKEDVVRMNLHKREAVVQVRFMGKPAEMKLGIEITDIQKRR